MHDDYETYQRQLKSPMNLALHWNEDILLWEVVVRFHGKRLGVTQVRHLDELGQTVHDYISIASVEPMDPRAAVTASLISMSTSDGA